MWLSGSLESYSKDDWNTVGSISSGMIWFDLVLHSEEMIRGQICSDCNLSSTYDMPGTILMTLYISFQSLLEITL